MPTVVLAYQVRYDAEKVGRRLHDSNIFVRVLSKPDNLCHTHSGIYWVECPVAICCEQQVLGAMIQAPSTRLIWGVIPYVLIAYLYFYMMMLQATIVPQNPLPAPTEQSRQTPLTRGAGVVPDGMIGSDSSGSGSSISSSNIVQALKDRVQMLEAKLNTYLGYNSDPFLWSNVPAKCKNKTGLEEYCVPAKSCDIGMYVCLDHFPYNDCTVYDFGIREQPEFGVVLSKPPFNCKVYAFDPSPITRQWFETNQELKQNPNYHLFHYGGGGADELITLREYDWQQVSIYSYPKWVVAKPRNCTNSGCRFQKFKPQKLHNVPVRSVGSIMAELGHDRVDVLKLDVEGSEYRMLEGLIDTKTCQKIGQLTLEWHHFTYDARYGASSIPHLNVFTRLLQDECGLSQFWLHDDTGWPSNEELYIDMQITLRYNLASFMQVKQ